MLKSMTAFARRDLDTGSGILTWELRSVNHRYLEPAFRLPDLFREAEPRFRNQLRNFLARGKVECMLKWQPALASDKGLQVNPTVLKQLSKATEAVAGAFVNASPVNPIEVLQWPGVVDTGLQDRKQIFDQAEEALIQTLEIMLANREREGEQIMPMLTQRLDGIAAIVAEVREQLPGILARQSEQIHQRFEEASVELDEARVEQELVLLAQKSDVAEELDRLDAHVTEVRSVLTRDEPVGRRLDFLMQELNREANTLSSKAVVINTTNAAVELKVLIEQMREQIQNVE